MPTPRPPSLIVQGRVDPPVIQDANYAFTDEDRAYLDSQIRGCESWLVRLLLSGVVGTLLPFDISLSTNGGQMGDVVCLSGQVQESPRGSIPSVTLATPTALAAAGRAAGILLSAVPPGGNALVALGGAIGPGTTGLAAGTGKLYARVSTANRAELVTSISPGDFVLGTVDAAGDLLLETLLNLGSGGASLPSGAEGDLLLYQAGAWTVLAPGAAGQVIGSTGPTSAPTYRNLPQTNTTSQAGFNLALVTASSGGNSGVISNVATLTLSGTSCLVLVDWVGQVFPACFRVIPSLEYSVDGGTTWTDFAEGRCPGIPSDGSYTASGIDTTIHFNRVLNGLPQGATVKVRLKVTCYGASGNFNDGVGDAGLANVLTLIDLG